MTDYNKVDQTDELIETIRAELSNAEPTARKRILEAIALAALETIPWVGGFLAAAASVKLDEGTARRDSLRNQWLEGHHQKLKQLHETLEGLFARLESFGDEIDDRLKSKEYLALVRKAFREWDQADTDEKRTLIVQLITNAAGTRLCSDDIIRLFLDWTVIYHEAHFAVIREIHKNQGPTRYDIWVAVYGRELPRDDSPEADLYKMLIRDLTIGGVIRQARETDAAGRFRKKTASPRRASSPTLETPFEDTKQYVLTELGKQFVHYTMNDVITRISASTETSGEASTPINSERDTAN
ncbi:MAG: hypothetical protein WBD67_01910 [Terracidiphilus sp.]